MSVIIKSVDKWSPAFFKGVKAGDKLVSINGNEINDFLDYQFYVENPKLVLKLERNNKTKTVNISLKEIKDIGLQFNSFLMDKQKRCHNKCIFCFIDQNPEGMRETIYFKDDDSRLSFLFGNYITLTNLTQKDIDRIIKMHISPVNVSVHTMNKELRVKMMNNKKAGDCLDMLYQLAKAGIDLNTQLVLCPGINDGEELKYSLEKLGELYPAVQSVAAVPVGITKHREGLFDMPEYNAETSKKVIEIIDEFGRDFKNKHGTRLAYAADEFYLKAGMDIPEADYYENYPQIENGIGMWRSFLDEAMAAIDDLDRDIDIQKKISVATGSAAYPLIKKICDELTAIYGKIEIEVFQIKNNFYGETITVAGLVTGSDIISQLKGKIYSETLLIPDVMLMSDSDLFLDNISVSQIENELNVKINTVSSRGTDLIDKILA